MNCCLVIDISKISLKIISVILRDEKMFMQEVHKCTKIFETRKDSKLFLNVDKIIKEINDALVSIKQIGYNVKSISINSDVNEFLFLDENNNLIEDILIDRVVELKYLNKLLNEMGIAYIYRKTGKVFNLDNLVCKLMMYKDLFPNNFSRIRKIVALSDYINYKLTGKLFNEVTNLGLTQFFNFKDQNVDMDILNYLGLRDKLEFNLINYGDVVGDCDICGGSVIAPYGNNLLSSFLSTDVTNRGSIFIVNSYEGIIGCTEDFSKMYLEGLKFELNHQMFSNGFLKIFKYIPCYRVVNDLLKNIDNNYLIENTWNTIEENKIIDHIIDFDSEIFKNSASLLRSVKYYFEFKLNTLSDSVSNFIRIIYDSFAVYYKKCIKDLERITGGIFDNVCMVGDYITNRDYNQFISNIISKDLEIGPKDSGLIGNAVNQFVSIDEIKNISQAYGILKNSFNYSKIKYSGKRIVYKYLENVI